MHRDYDNAKVAIVHVARMAGAAVQRNHFRLYNIALKNCFQRSDLYKR